MKTMHILTVLTLYAMLLPGCRSTETPAVIVPQGTPSAGDPARLIDCELQHKDSETNFAAACSKLVTLLDQEVKQQNILGMVMAERLTDGTVIWATSGYTGPSGKEAGVPQPRPLAVS